MALSRGRERLLWLAAVAALAGASYRAARAPAMLEVPEGYRAVAVPSDYPPLAPGARVDVFVTCPASALAKDAATMRVFENVLTLGVRAEKGREAAILCLNPVEASYASLVVDGGCRARLALRRTGDVESNPGEIASWRKLRQ